MPAGLRVSYPYIIRKLRYANNKRKMQGPNDNAAAESEGAADY